MGIRGIIIVVIIIFTGFFLWNESNKLPATVFKAEELKIAACPTFYYMLNDLEDEGMTTVKTSSTAESIALLSDGKVDFFISGRAPMPGEPDFFYEVIGPGFSFIYKDEIFIFEEEMSHVPFYTDLSVEKIRNKFPLLAENLQEVEDVYNHLEEGIGITSLENTDYSKSRVVYVLQEDGTKSRYSRVPTLYYLSDEDYYLKIKEIIKNN